MNFFELKLAPRLFLASLSGILWMYMPESLGVLSDLHLHAWGMLFGLSVLAPFIVASRMRALRTLTLVAIAYAIHLAVGMTIGMTSYSLDAWIDSEHLDFVNAVPIVIVGTWSLAAATAWIAPLRVSPRYWTYTGLAGLAAGSLWWWWFETLTFNIFSGSNNDFHWRDLLMPWVTWPVAICIGIYYGRLPALQSKP